ncbi:helix-turn-helix transcriptional regulator [Kineococcus arenarius]|uniref:helix-turn-helix transcriptional regulator n=1 Tax=unclassified Kineococcus TaxID=2621656 RepID=UPI003D7D88E5
MDAAALAVAAEIGALTASEQGSGVADRALELLSLLVPSDASALQVVEGTFTSFLATHGDLRHVSVASADEFLRDPNLPRVVGAELPLSLSTDPGNSFREGTFFRRYLEPAGFRDGVSVHLGVGGSTLGFLHLSATQEVFGHRERTVLAALRPVLAGWLHRDRSTSGLSDRLPAGAFAAVVVGGRVEELAGHDLPPFLGDQVFRRVLEQCGSSTERRLTAWWDDDRQWYRFVVEPLHHDGRRTGGHVPLLVHAVAGPLPSGLTRREVDVLTCLALGMDNASIAQVLGVSLRTVHSHVEGVRRRTGSASRLEAAAYAHREGVLHPLRQLPGGGVDRLSHRR